MSWLSVDVLEHTLVLARILNVFRIIWMLEDVNLALEGNFMECSFTSYNQVPPQLIQHLNSKLGAIGLIGKLYIGLWV